ncbi:CU044_2847 family protein [Actinomadura rubrisoli]|uniref:Trypsin-co-occurring domain-containing protein n=1 Tax=Actinomadura rubrisoli TaxID=2530368 RepID=A0A4R5C3N6_9ACTN|nr:CU044_2847 family protein [Actinomadura rubrisoli]TDD93515.1 hypothetical protein E1298_09310 [Actinomadura rubrisoli]
MRYNLEDGSEVVFETTEHSLVSQRGGQPKTVDGGELEQRIAPIAQTAEAISRGLREKLSPDEIELSLGVKVSGKVNWWFIASSAGEAAITVTLRWNASSGGAEPAAGTTGP